MWLAGMGSGYCPVVVSRTAPVRVTPRGSTYAIGGAAVDQRGNARTRSRQGLRRYRRDMEIGGLPLHPLVVHAAVVFTPLAVLAVIVFALWPRHRWLTRWPTVVLTVLAAGSVVVARQSGLALVDARPALAPLVEEHQARANVLGPLVLVLLVLVAVGAWSLGGPSALASGAGARESRVAALDRVLPVLLVLVALAVLVMVVLTGDSGSRAVWG